jgi:hypothetical protein
MSRGRELWTGRKHPPAAETDDARFDGSLDDNTTSTIARTRVKYLGSNESSEYRMQSSCHWCVDADNSVTPQLTGAGLTAMIRRNSNLCKKLSRGISRLGSFRLIG